MISLEPVAAALAEGVSQVARYAENLRPELAGGDTPNFKPLHWVVVALWDFPDWYGVRWSGDTWSDCGRDCRYKII